MINYVMAVRRSVVRDTARCAGLPATLFGQPAKPWRRLQPAILAATSWCPSLIPVHTVDTHCHRRSR